MKTNYKRALTILLLLLSCVMLSSATKSPYYTKSVVVTKVFPHKSGYKIYYMANSMEMKEVYLQSNLFEEQEKGGRERSKLFTGYNKAYPYMTIFWKDGEFSHVKLYLQVSYSDPSWGTFPNPSAEDENFKNAVVKFDF